MVVRDDSAARIFPEIKPFDYQTAVELALLRLDSGEVETVWSDTLMTSQGDVPPVVLTTVEGMNLEHRQLQVSADAATVYAAFAGLGGRRGWLYMNWVWHVPRADRPAGGRRRDAAAAGATPTACGWARRWISGTSRRSSRIT